MAANIQGVPFKLNSADLGGIGGFDLGEAIKSGFNNYKGYHQAKYEPRNLENAAYAAELANKIKEPYAENALRAFEADIGGQEANSGLTRENTLKQKILNEFLREREPAEIEEIRQRGKYYGMGGSSGSTGSKDYMAYVDGISKDNPGLNAEQLKEATDVLARGGTQLSDGTPLKPMSFGTRTAFDRAVKASTTAQQINNLNNANQAESELDVFNRKAQEMRAPYGTTYFGKSPQAIVDSFKSDDASQTRLGKLIAANMVTFEIAQIQNRIAQGAPGITSTMQLIEEGKQHIPLYGAKLSAKAREVANEEYTKIIKEGLAARNKAGYAAGNLYTRANSGGENGAVNPASNINTNPNSPENTDAFVNQISAQLITTMPEATPENIKHTAQETGKTIDQVIAELVEAHKRIIGRQ
jgi:hypothetical protein